MDDVPPFEEPKDRAVEDWIAEDYKKRLKAVGKDASGKKPELKDRVMRYKSLPLEDQPTYLPPECGKAEGVLDVLRTMVIMFTTVLQPAVEGENHSKILAVRVRLFLNAVAEFEAPLRARRKQAKMKILDENKKKKKSVFDSGNLEAVPEEAVPKEDVQAVPEEAVPDDNKPLWLARYNFLSLLNLPDMIKLFGTPRNYFEGKYLGEKYVQEVKTCRLRCGHRNVPVNIMRKLHQGKALDSMVTTQSKLLKTYRATESCAVINAGKLKKKNIQQNARVYSDRAGALKAFSSYTPLSAKESNRCGFGILFYSKGSNLGGVSLLELVRLDSGISVHHGLRYWIW